MIEELKKQICRWDQEGKLLGVAGPPTLEDVINKVNEIIRYLNEREGNHFRESTKMIDEPVKDCHGLEEEAQSWAGSSAVDAFKAGVEWQKKQFTWEDIANIDVYISDVEYDFQQAGRRLGDDAFYQEVFKRFVESKKGLLRPFWVPSEEQMKALSDACCIAFEEERDFHPSLSRLYHDLRKL